MAFNNTQGTTHMSVTEKIKAALWSNHGTHECPTEWDGRVYGGGKISQRYWEYLISIEMLDLKPDSVLIDIGGGSPTTGVGIFARSILSAGIKVIVVDENLGAMEGYDTPNLILEKGLADKNTLSTLIEKYNPTHISCVSVLEHASAAQQMGIFEAIEASFHGEKAVFSFEFHETTCFVEQQLTTTTLSNAVSCLKRFYLNRMEKSPLNCVNSVIDRDRLWYPLALQFNKINF